MLYHIVVVFSILRKCSSMVPVPVYLLNQKKWLRILMFCLKLLQDIQFWRPFLQWLSEFVKVGIQTEHCVFLLNPKKYHDWLLACEYKIIAFLWHIIKKLQVTLTSLIDRLFCHHKTDSSLRNEQHQGGLHLVCYWGGGGPSVCCRQEPDCGHMVCGSFTGVQEWACG